MKPEFRDSPKLTKTNLLLPEQTNQKLKPILKGILPDPSPSLA